MAILYVRSTDGSDADTGATWLLAKATLAGAFAAAAAGDTIYVSQVHAETQATAMTLTSPGTAASPCTVLCANDAVEPPTALATTGTITTTGNSAISFAGFAYVYGITFTCGSGVVNASINFIAATPWWYRFEACSLGFNSSAGSAALIGIGDFAAGVDDSLLEFHNTKVAFTSVGQSIRPRSRFKWTGTATAITGATLPTTLFLPTGTSVGALQEITGVDLSALGAAKNLVNLGTAMYISFQFTDCKLGSSITFITGTIAGPGSGEVRVVNCDSADTNHRYHYQNYQGTITSETTIIRTGGASDGTTALSRKMATTANSKFYLPLADVWGIPIWNETLSAITVTIPVLTDNITLTNADAWIEVEYLGTSGFPLGVYTSDRSADILATPANQTTDGVSSWASAPGTPVKQSLAVTFTPAEKGVLRARVVLARPSTTIYYDPLLQIT